MNHNLDKQLENGFLTKKVKAHQIVNTKKIKHEEIKKLWYSKRPYLHAKVLNYF